MVWTCPKCSKMAPLMMSMQKDMKDLKKSQTQLMGLLIDIKENLKTEKQLRENTEEELWRLRGQYKELVEELHVMTNKVTASHNPAPKVTKSTYAGAATPPAKPPPAKSPPEPTKSLLIGTSLLRNVNHGMMDNWEVIAKGGAKIEDFNKVLAEMPPSRTYKELVFIAGSIDLDTGSIDDLLNAYRAFTVLASDKAQRIKISSVLPRTDKDYKEKTKSLNQELKKMCDTDGFEFIENDPTFHLLNGDVNSALLLDDGLHLAQAGVETLIRNCLIKTKGSPYTNKRYPKPQTKTLFKGHENPLSNFYPVHGLKVFGRYFNTSEAAYQYKKAVMMGNEDMAWKIEHSQTGIKAMQLGSKVRSSEEWHTNKAKVMENVIHAKLKVCKVARDALINSGTSEILEDTDHPFWARGTDGNGQNMMGKILMMYRRKMREDPAIFKSPAPQPKTTPNQNNHRRWASQDYQPKCYRCGEEGHVQDRCRHLQDVYCWTCGYKGHKAKSCDSRPYSQPMRRY